jgi:hypothetical protein
MRYEVKRMGQSWWVIGGEGPIGPYNNKAEAEETRKRLNRFERYEDEPGYITCESLKSKENRTGRSAGLR